MSTAVKERPILFSAPMVRAILSGDKTQTRRIEKRLDPKKGAVTTDIHGKPMRSVWAYGGPILDCPYGQPGDRLWVREAFAEEYDYCDHPEMPGAPTEHFHYAWHYRADGEPKRDQLDGFLSSWKPSIHMPRIASRIQLEITGVRVEHLQEISEADAVSEGIRISSKVRQSETCYGICECALPDGLTHFNDSAYDLYRKLWEQINGPGSWQANPWVWVVEFRRIA